MQPQKPNLILPEAIPIHFENIISLVAIQTSSDIFYELKT